MRLGMFIPRGYFRLIARSLSGLYIGIFVSAVSHYYNDCYFHVADMKCQSCLGVWQRILFN